MRFPQNEDGRYNGKSGIYRITNLINQKVYIGQSTDLGRRFHNYIVDVENKNIKNPRPIIQAMRDYGHRFFEFEVLCECPVNMLNEMEEHYSILNLAHDCEYGYNAQGIYVDMNYARTSIDLRKRLRDSHTGLKESADTKRKKSNKIFAIDEEKHIIYIFDSGKLFGSSIGVGKDLVKNCLREPSRCGNYRLYYFDYEKRREILDKQKRKYYENVGKRGWNKLDPSFIELGNYLDKISSCISVETTETPDGEYAVVHQTYENTIQLNYNMPRKDIKSRIPEES